jgi:hypothetical protein
MHSSISWVEWLDRLDRVLQSAVREFGAYVRSGSARSLAAIDRSRRQLRALTEELRLLDPQVLGPSSPEELQAALDTLIFRLDGLPQPTAPVVPFRDRERDRLLLGIHGALREARYRAASVVQPRSLFA